MVLSFVKALTPAYLTIPPSSYLHPQTWLLSHDGILSCLPPQLHYPQTFTPSSWNLRPLLRRIQQVNIQVKSKSSWWSVQNWFFSCLNCHSTSPKLVMGALQYKSQHTSFHDCYNGSTVFNNHLLLNKWTIKATFVECMLYVR